MKKQNAKNGAEPAYGHGGARTGSGRKKTDRVKVLVSLRRDTIDQFRKGDGRRGRDWSQYLQTHLDRFPTDEVLAKKYYMPSPTAKPPPKFRTQEEFEKWWNSLKRKRAKQEKGSR